MAISLTFATGPATVSTTEISLISGTSTLQTNTTVGLYQVFLDCSAMAAGDAFNFSIYETAQAGGTKRKCLTAALAGVQSTPQFVSPPLTLGVGWDMTLTKVGGTDRSFAYSIRQVA